MVSAEIPLTSAKTANVKVAEATAAVRQLLKRRKTWSWEDVPASPSKTPVKAPDRKRVAIPRGGTGEVSSTESTQQGSPAPQAAIAPLDSVIATLPESSHAASPPHCASNTTSCVRTMNIGNQKSIEERSTTRESPCHDTLRWTAQTLCGSKEFAARIEIGSTGDNHSLQLLITPLEGDFPAISISGKDILLFEYAEDSHNERMMIALTVRASLPPIYEPQGRASPPVGKMTLRFTSTSIPYHYEAFTAVLEGIECELWDHTQFQNLFAQGRIAPAAHPTLGGSMEGDVLKRAASRILDRKSNDISDARQGDGTVPLNRGPFLDVHASKPAYGRAQTNPARRSLPVVTGFPASPHSKTQTPQVAALQAQKYRRSSFAHSAFESIPERVPTGLFLSLGATSFDYLKLAFGHLISRTPKVEVTCDIGTVKHHTHDPYAVYQLALLFMDLFSLTRRSSPEIIRLIERRTPGVQDALGRCSEKVRNIQEMVKAVNGSRVDRTTDKEVMKLYDCQVCKRTVMHVIPGLIYNGDVVKQEVVVVV